MAKTTRKPSPGQDDESDIVSNPGAEPTNSGDVAGPAVANEGAVRETRVTDTGDRPSRGTSGEVHETILQQYETVSRIWPVSSLVIFVKRLGSEIEWTITSQPRNASELYAAIRALHGHHGEATYSVVIRDSQQQNRGSGRVTLPDTREEQLAQPQSGPPAMNPYNPHYPYPYAPPPGYAPPQPQVHAAGVAGMDAQAFMAFQRQQFDMWQQAQRGQVPPPGQPPMPQPASAQPPPVAAPPPAQPAVAGMDYAAFMALQQQQFEMWQQAQRVAQPSPMPTPAPVAAAPQQPQPAAPIPGMFNVPGFGYVPISKLMQALGVVGGDGQPAAQPPQAQPVVQVPEGMFHVPGFGFVPAERLFQALSGNPPGPQYRGPGPGYRGRPGYGGYPPNGSYPPDGQHAPYDPRYGQPPPQSPPPPKTVRDHFEEVGSFMAMFDEYADRFGRGGTPAAPAPPEPPPEDDSPIKVIDTGPAKIVINKDNGSARFWETLVTNSPGIFKWVGEQADAIQRAANEREAAKRRSQQLPPGYVEVGPGYVPPPGYVPVPIDQIPPQHALPPQQQPPAQPPLPQPPAQMPPPINQQPQDAPAQRRTWDLPGVTR